MNSTGSGNLYLIPVPIVANTYNQVLPEYNRYIVHQIEHFLVEDVSSARKYIKAIGHAKPIAELHFNCLDKHNPMQDMRSFMQPLQEGKDIGVLAEAGCPGIADPGAWVVQYAHKNGITVIPLVGPCSILLALMASGFNGQNFAFHGYLPIDKVGRKQAIKKLETAAWQSGQTQIFIETPYRNDIILEILLETCRPSTWLCIGKNITDPKGWIKSNTIQNWKKDKPMLHKVPTVFLLARQEQF
ncbi:MAG: SAM-dependent methyltransferase [Candidatus Amoebophilus sp.]